MFKVSQFLFEDIFKLLSRLFQDYQILLLTMTDPADPNMTPPAPDPVLEPVFEHPEPEIDPRNDPLPPGSIDSPETTPDVTPTTLTHQVTNLMNLMDSAFKDTTMDWAAVAPPPTLNHLLTEVMALPEEGFQYFINHNLLTFSSIVELGCCPVHELLDTFSRSEHYKPIFL